MKTINLKGKTYAPVSSRVEEFHKDHKDGSISTDTTFSDGYVIVKATVSFSDRTFTGHSYGTVKGEKAFEKLETTAVGRALAFAGYLAGGEIASYDEMQDYVDTENAAQANSEPLSPMSVDDAFKKIGAVTSVEELNKVYKSLSPQMQKDEEVIAKCKEVKEGLEEIIG